MNSKTIKYHISALINNNSRTGVESGEIMKQLGYDFGQVYSPIQELIKEGVIKQSGGKFFPANKFVNRSKLA